MLSSNFTVCHRPVVSLRSRRRGSFPEDCGEVRNVQRCLPLSQVRQQSQSGPEVRAGATQEAVFIPYLPPSVDAELLGDPVFQPLPENAENADAKPAAPELASEQASPPMQKPMRSTGQTLREIAALSIPALGSTLADPVCTPLFALQVLVSLICSQPGIKMMPPYMNAYVPARTIFTIVIFTVAPSCRCAVLWTQLRLGKSARSNLPP